MGAINHFCPAKSLSINNRHNIALQAMRHEHKITEIAIEK